MRANVWAWGLLVVALFGAGCDALGGLAGGSKDEKRASKDDDEDDDDKPKKKKKKKDTEATASASAALPAPTATPSVAPTPAPTPPTPAADPLASFFSEPVDPSVKFLRQKNLKGEPIWVQVLPGWETSRDDPSIDYVDGELFVYGKENHAVAYLSMRPKLSGFPMDKLDFECQRVSAQKCSFAAPVDGTFGESKLPAKIAKGTAMRVKTPIDVYYAIADYKDRSLFVLVSLRKDVYPKLEGELLSTVRSTKVDPAQR